MKSRDTSHFQRFVSSRLAARTGAEFSDGSPPSARASHGETAQSHFLIFFVHHPPLPTDPLPSPHSFSLSLSSSPFDPPTLRSGRSV